MHATRTTSELRTAINRCRGSLAMTGLFSLFVNLLMLTGPIYMMQIYDNVLASHSYSTLVALSVLVVVLMVFLGTLEMIRSRVLVRIGARIDGQLADRVFDAVVRRNLKAGRAGDEQPLRDLRAIREFLSGQGPIALFDSPWVPIYLAVVFLLHPILGLVASAGAVLLFLIALLNEGLTRRPLAEATGVAFNANAIAMASQRNAEAVQSMGMLPGLRQRWRVLHWLSLRLQERASDRGGTLTALSKTLRLTLQSAILGVGAALVIEQAISPGAMIAASIIMGRAVAPVDQAIGNWRNFIGVRSAYRRLEILLARIAPAPLRMGLPAAQGSLQVDRLVAGPPDASRAVVSGISFRMQAGEAICIIGPSASGKSTLARLLVGVWVPQLGEIRLDGAELDQWDSDALGRQIGYLPQDVELFPGTVGENISRFDEDPDPASVVAAARAAGVHDMILRLPDGYNTEIGADGGKLSGGQRQRIALARALYGDPALIVLDEPNANLDADGDQALAAAIRGMKARGQMIIVMTHRPGVIEAADHLLVLEGGRQTAFGPPADVLASHVQNVAAIDTPGSTDTTAATDAKVAALPRRSVS